jgi:hypothetical protein
MVERMTDYRTFLEQQVDRDALKDNLIAPHLLDTVLCFHQSQAFFLSPWVDTDPIPARVRQWLNDVQKTPVVPSTVESIVEVSTVSEQWPSSARHFDPTWPETMSDLEAVITGAFGANKDTLSRRYGSAGGLYPVIPIVVVLDDALGNRIELAPGPYVWDPANSSLLGIWSWTPSELPQARQAFAASPPGCMANLCIAYAIDMRRAIIKYRERGYRHAMIEVGAMSQCMRESLREQGQELGDRSWSGFTDNAATYWCGLNVRLCPVVLVQWIGRTLGRDQSRNV